MAGGVGAGWTKRNKRRRGGRPAARVARTVTPRDASGGSAAATTAEGGRGAAPVRGRAASDAPRFRGVADQAPVVLWTTDATGVCTYINNAWHAYTGQSEAEALGLGWLDAIHPEDRPEAERVFRAANAAREPFRLEYRLRRADGAHRWALDLGRPRFAAAEDGAGFLGFVGSVIDIHVRREAEERLRHSEASARLAIEAGRLGTWSLDPDTGVLEWDARCRALFGLPPGDGAAHATYRDLLRACHPGDRARLDSAVSAALADPARAGAVAEDFRVAVPAKGGRERWLATAGRGFFDDAGRCKRLVGVVADVTDRRRAEVALRERNEALERDVEDRTRERDRIWENSRDLLLVVGPGGVVQAANPAWDVTLGHDADDLVGQHFTRFILPEDAEPSRAAMERTAAEGLPHFENRYRHRDGSFRWLSWTAARAGDSLYCVARDVTADKAREAELAAAQEQLRQAQKMEAVGQLTGGIAHDFNNLLQVVIGNLEILQRNLPEDAARLRRAAGNAMSGARRAATLTARLLAFSRRQPLAPRPVDVNGLVAGMSDLLGRTLGETVRLETALSDGLWLAEADPNQLENAVLNLAVNSRDAMPDGGRLFIEAANARLDSAYAARNADTKPGQYVVLSVSDTGVGMDKRTMERVFEPFFTTKEVGKGTGLGLSQVYGFVKQSGGHVAIYSELGEGTTVRIYLPRSLGDAAKGEESRESPEPAASRAETVLVVEDSAEVRAYSVEVLRELGYRVLEAADGPAALDLLGRPGAARVDLLFTDVILPGGMTGTALAERARALRPGLKVLFTTGYAQSAATRSGRVDPGVELITKPFAYADLAARTRAVLDGSGG